jgi:hypothetical protein
MKQAKSEADHAIRLVEPYKDKMSYPVYLDLEEAGTETGAVERAITFGEILEREGYWCGIYASESWWKGCLSGGVLDRFTKWVAKYGVNDGNAHTQPSIEDMDIWQYTSKGAVNGISGNVDMNICYRDLPSEIKPQKASGKWKVGQVVSFGTSYPQPFCIAGITQATAGSGHGRITNIVEGQAKYQIENGRYYCNDGDIVGVYTEPQVVTPVARTYAHHIGEHITFSTCYKTSTDTNSAAIGADKMAKNHGTITKIVDAKNPYLIDDGMCWVNDGDIRGAYTAPAVNYYPAYTGSSVSVVDALNSIGVDSSKENRTSIAAKNGISGYSGTASQNTKIMNLLKQGKLVM